MTIGTLSLEMHVLEVGISDYVTKNMMMLFNQMQLSKYISSKQYQYMEWKLCLQWEFIAVPSSHTSILQSQLPEVDLARQPSYKQSRAMVTGMVFRRHIFQANSQKMCSRPEYIYGCPLYKNFLADVAQPTSQAELIVSSMGSVAFTFCEGYPLMAPDM